MNMLRILFLLLCGFVMLPGRAAAVHPAHLLDAPLLFVKRHSYSGIHIYDTYYKWPPGGGGIYLLENPSAPKDQWRIRAIIDPTTPETLGHVVRALMPGGEILFQSDVWDITLEALAMLEANEGLLSERSEGEAFAAADPGRSYLLYFPEGGSVGLDLSDFADREFSLDWVDLRSASYGTASTVAGGAVASITAPDGGAWVAIITR